MKKNGFLLFLILLGTFAVTTLTAGQLTDNVATFIENKGQIVDFDGKQHPEIYFMWQTKNANVYFSKKGISYYFFKNEEINIDTAGLTPVQKLNAINCPKAAKTYYYHMDMLFESSNPANITMEPVGKSSAYSNFYLPYCPDGILYVKRYGSIKYKNVYPGIDFVFFIKHGNLKYNIEVSPKADPAMVKLLFDGAKSINKISSRKIVVKTPITDIVETMPEIFYADSHEPIEGSFGLDNNTLFFNVPKYNTNRKIVIDPVQYWSTYFDYNLGSNTQNARPVFDSQGNIYNAGRVQNTGFPMIDAGGGQYFQSTMSGTYEVIIYKFNSSNDLQWSTYYGASMSDNVAWPGRAVAMDDDDNLFVLMNIVGGGSSGGTFPTYNPSGGAFYQDQSRLFSWYNSVIGEFDANGVRKWVTVISHENSNTDSQDFTVWGISSKNNKIYFTGISGQANSNTIPLRSLSGAYYQPAEIGSVCPFVGRFSNTGVLEWCTYLHSGNSSYSSYNGQGYDVQMDANNNLWFVGLTSTSSGAGQGHLTMDPGGAYYQPLTMGSSDIIFTKFDTSLQPVWSSYYGGSSTDNLQNVSSDSKGNMYIVGYTYSSDFDTYDPGGSAYYRSSTANNSNVTNNYIAKFSSDYQLAWATTYSENSTFIGVECGSNDNVYVYGTSPGTAFVTQSETGSYNDNSYNSGSSDYVFLKFDSIGVRKWATFYGGTDSEGGGVTGRSGMNIFFNPCSTTSKLVIFGGTQSTDFPIQDPGGGALFQGTKTSSGMAPVIIEFDETMTSGISTAPSSVTSSSNPVCSGSATTLSVNGGSLGTGASWEWYTGTCGGTHVGSGTSVTVSPASTTTYYVRAEGTCNITSCTSITITVNTLSTDPVSVFATENPVCEGNSTTLTVNGGSLGTGASWQWYTGGCGGTNIGSGSSIIVSPTNNTTYYVRAEGTCNTTGCASVAITVTPGANAGIDGSIDVCYGSMSFDMFTVLGGIPDAGGTWTDGGGNTVSSVFDPSTQSSGIFTYTVTGSGSCGDDSATVTVTVNPLPTVSFTGLDSSYCGSGGDYIVLTGNQAPDGSFSGTDVADNSNGTANFLPQNTGTYTITYTYTDANGCSASDVQSTTVYPSPSVHFVGLDTGYCLGSSPVNLIGNQAPNGLYSGVGITDNMDGSAVFLPDSVGQFDITYSYTDGNGCTGVDVQQVNVYDNPSFDNITVTDVTVCSPPYDGEIAVSGTGGNGSYQFAIDGGTFSTDTLFDTLSIGNYTISIMDDYGCLSDTTVAVGGNTGFSINQVDVQNLLCYGDSSGEITISATNGTQYSIDNGTTFQSDSVFTDLSAGTYFIQVTNSFGCTALDTVTIIEPSQLAYDYEQDSVSCYGYSDGSITLNVTGGTPGYTYSWSPSGYTLTGNVYLDLPEGSYAVTVTDANGCSFDIPKIEIRQPNPLIVHDSIGNATCYGQNNGTATILVTGGIYPYSYYWTGDYTTPQVNNLSTGIYLVTVTDNNSCQIVDTIIITSPTAVEISESMTMPSCIDNNDGSIVVAVSGGEPPYAYLWSNTDTDSSAENLTAGTYYLTLTDANSCETITSYELPDGESSCLTIPDIFTPNGDGTNDTWVIEGIDLYPDATVEIYNRWGDLIFKSTGYKEPWDGTWHGKELPISSFIYIINLNNGLDPIQGIVTIKK